MADSVNAPLKVSPFKWDYRLMASYIRFGMGTETVRSLMLIELTWWLC